MLKGAHHISMNLCLVERILGAGMMSLYVYMAQVGCNIILKKLSVFSFKMCISFAF
jgi:hypothetical protein